MTFVTPSFKAASRTLYAREMTFAVKVYAVAAVAGIAISFGSALLGYPLVTFQQAPQSIEPATAPLPLTPPVQPKPIDTRPAFPLPGGDGPDVAASKPTQEDYYKLKLLIWETAKQAPEATLTDEPRIGDTVPGWVQVKPLPPNAESKLVWTGFVGKGSQATAVFRYAEDAVIVNSSRQVVGVVPRK
jgi:hypothetical protein